MPFDETADDGKEARDRFGLPDEAICVAHYVGRGPRVEDEGYVRLDCFQLVSECNARGSLKHVVGKHERDRNFSEQSEASAPVLAARTE